MSRRRKDCSNTDVMVNTSLFPSCLNLCKYDQRMSRYISQAEAKIWFSRRQQKRSFRARAQSKISSFGQLQNVKVSFFCKASVSICGES